MIRTFRTSATLSVVTFLACAAFAFAAETGPITPERAQQIALAQTGGGQIVLLVHSGGGPNQFYKIEVVNNNTRYHLQIDAFNGSLHKFVQNRQGGGGAPIVVTPPANAATPVIPPSIATGTAPLTRDQALALAQQMTNGGTVVESKTEIKKYGQTIHEFELINNGVKYEIDIDADTGNILEFTQKGGYASFPPSPIGGAVPRLDMAAAVEIAKRRTNGGAVTDYELDTDNNRLIHEVEIENGNRRYEVEIDDATGEIVKLKQK